MTPVPRSLFGAEPRLTRSIHRGVVAAALVSLLATPVPAQRAVVAPGTPADSAAATSRVLGDSLAFLTRHLRELRRDVEVERLSRVEAEQTIAQEREQTQRAYLVGAALIAVLAIWSFVRRRRDRAQLTETLGSTDPLTGVWNRRYLQQVIPADASAAVRRHLAAPVGESPRDADLVFLLVDLDHFRLLNQRYGPEAGDRVLENVAKQLKASVRDSDLVVRWGGDSFLIAYRFTNRERVSEFAERIRHKLESLETVVRGGDRLRVTASIGFAAFPFTRSNPEGLGWEGAVAIADLAAYASKRDGRNGWSTFRAASGESGDVSLRDVTLRDIDARVAEGSVILESSRGTHQPAGV